MLKLKRVFLGVVAAIVLFNTIVLLIDVPHLFWTLGAVKHSTVQLLDEKSSLSQEDSEVLVEKFNRKQQQQQLDVDVTPPTWQLKHTSYDHHLHSKHTTPNSKTTETPPHSNKLDSIKHDLMRCSRAMGVPLETLESEGKTLKAITQKANQFLNAVHFLVPDKFSANSKNPCWYLNLSISTTGNHVLFSALFGNGLSKKKLHNFAKNMFESAHSHQTLMCLPSFFIAGFPKSATTSLDNAFRKHPQIIGPQAKEPHWWTRAQNLTVPSLDKDYARLSLYTYLLNFKPSAEHLSSSLGEDFITYDGSQSILWDSNFFVNHQDYCAMPAVLSRVLPDAKFIVMMRNPINRLYSHYLYSFSVRFGDDINQWPPSVRNNITEQFHLEVTKTVNHFWECLKLSTLFECVSEQAAMRTNKGQVNALNRKIVIGIYHVHLLKWFQFYPQNQFLLLRMEDLKTSPAKVMSQVTRFLEVDEVSEDKARKWFSKKANVNQAKGTQNEMEKRTRAILEDFYHPYNKMLAKMTDNNRFLWFD